MALHQGGDLAIITAAQKITFPVAWDRTILGFGSVAVLETRLLL